MANNYEIPKGLSRKDRRKHMRKLESMAKRLKLRWDKEEVWFKTLSEEDVEKAVNFKHEDMKINKRVKALADMEQNIVYYRKLHRKLKEYNTPKPIVKNGNTKEIQTV